MKYFFWLAAFSAKSAGYNLIKAVLFIGSVFIFFNILEGHVEALLFGEPFRHWLDVPILIYFAANNFAAGYLCGGRK